MKYLWFACSGMLWNNQKFVYGTEADLDKLFFYSMRWLTDKVSFVLSIKGVMELWNPKKLFTNEGLLNLFMSGQVCLPGLMLFSQCRDTTYLQGLKFMTEEETYLTHAVVDDYK